MAKIGKPRGVARYTSNGMLFIQRYRSISQAAISVGASTYSISAACKDMYKEVGGYKWRYFTYIKPKTQKPKAKRPEITEAQRLANIESVLNKIRKANDKDT